MKNHVPAYVKKAVVDLAIENPAQGQLRAFRNLNNVVRLFPVASCVHLVTLRSGNNEETLEGCDSQAFMMGELWAIYGAETAARLFSKRSLTSYFRIIYLRITHYFSKIQEMREALTGLSARFCHRLNALSMQYHCDQPF